MGKPDQKFEIAFRNYLREGKINEQIDSQVVAYIESLVNDIRINWVENYPKGFDYETDFMDWLSDRSDI